MKRKQRVPTEWETLWPVFWQNCSGCKSQVRWERMYQHRKFSLPVCTDCYMLVELQPRSRKGDIIQTLAYGNHTLAEILAQEPR